MKRYNIIYLFAFLFALLAGNEAWAQLTNSIPTIGEYNLTDNVNLSKTVAVSGTLTIINNTGRDITIKATANIDMFTVGSNKTLIIEGRNGKVIIDGGADFVPADDYPWTPTFTKNGSRNCNSCINTSGTLNLTNVVLQNVDKGSAGGGALTLGTTTGTTKLTNCTIRYCRSLQGAAISVGGGSASKPIELNNVIIEKNNLIYQESTWGGVIRFNGGWGGNLSMTNCIVRNNYANTGCAGLFWNAGGTNTVKCSLDGCEFTENWSRYEGGALRIETSMEFINNPTHIHNNKADTYGGGIHAYGYAAGGITIVGTFNYDLNENLLVYNNEAKYGGGIAFQFNDKCGLPAGTTINAIINGAQFYDNNSSEKGGGAFFENTTPSSKNYKININLNSGSIRKNDAKIGGGMYVNKIDIKSGGASGGVLDIIDNTATTGEGGGIYATNGNMTLDAVNIKMNDAKTSGGGIYYNSSGKTVKINTADIETNTAEVDGGGIYIAAGSLDMETGNIHGNVVGNNGGGVNIANGNLTMQKGYFSLNSAGSNGGGIYIAKGNLTMATGEIEQNKAKIDGGGINIADGSLTMSEGNVISNTADRNGGGFSITNGTITVSSGKVSKNISKNYGGGLYVYNAGSTLKNITFAGASVFSLNDAVYGGGVCADGRLNLQMDASIENNTAINGGGVFLINGVEMTFGAGLIRSNKASVSVENPVTLTTAYNIPVEDLQGVGGGIFLAGNNTSIKFSDAQQFGLYNNRADNAADDIFATGVGTAVNLPAVNDMSLKGFDVPTDKLYWVEDYVTGDTEYLNYGTKQLLESGTEVEDIQILRYQDALRNMKPMAQLPDNKLADFKDDYICLCLGYELIYVTLQKKGLDAGDVVTFNIKYKDKITGSLVTYRKVYVLGTSSEIDKKNIVLPTGKWLFQESDWGWKYETNPQYMNNAGVDPRDPEDGTIEITVDKNKVITVINTKKEEEDTNVPDWVDIREAEHIKVNIMGRKEEQ